MHNEGPVNLFLGIAEGIGLFLGIAEGIGETVEGSR